MTDEKVVITKSKIKEWERLNNETAAQMAALSKEHEKRTKQIEYGRFFLGSSEPIEHQEAEEDHGDPRDVEVLGSSESRSDDHDEPTLADAIIAVLGSQNGRALKTSQIKDLLTTVGYPSDKANADNSYIYTVTGRLLKKGILKRRKNKMLALAPNHSENLLNRPDTRDSWADSHTENH